MKNNLIIFLIGIALVACKGPSGDKAIVSDAQDNATASTAAKTLAIDIANSTVSWEGHKPTQSHNGIIKLSNGSISLENGKITAGNFIMDMNTLSASDVKLNADFNKKLTDHLKSADFFDVTKYPTAKFVVAKVEDIADHATEDALKLEGATHYISGNLTMKDSTKGVSFPAVISINEEGINAMAEFVINRTDWGMHYGNDKSFGDKFIHPEVKIGFKIKAN